MRLLIVLFFLIAAFSDVFTYQQTAPRRRLYAMCPPKFLRIGSECYHISQDRLSWLDAHFSCKDKNGKLAEPLKISDRKLRRYLQVNDRDGSDLWIGATYDSKTRIWTWAHTGREVTYQSFSQLNPSEDLHYHCAVIDPRLKFRWSARSCVDQFRYICQHKMPKVSKKNREKVYHRWNITFPNEYANEVVMEVPVLDRRGYTRNYIGYKYSNVTKTKVFVDCRVFVIPNHGRQPNVNGPHRRNQSSRHPRRRLRTTTTTTTIRPTEYETPSPAIYSNDINGPLDPLVRFVSDDHHDYNGIANGNGRPTHSDIVPNSVAEIPKNPNNENEEKPIPQPNQYSPDRNSESKTTFDQRVERQRQMERQRRVEARRERQRLKKMQQEEEMRRQEAEERERQQREEEAKRMEEQKEWSREQFEREEDERRRIAMQDEERMRLEDEERRRAHIEELERIQRENEERQQKLIEDQERINREEQERLIQEQFMDLENNRVDTDTQDPQPYNNYPVTTSTDSPYSTLVYEQTTQVYQHPTHPSTEMDNAITNYDDEYQRMLAEHKKKIERQKAAEIERLAREEERHLQLEKKRQQELQKHNELLREEEEELRFRAQQIKEDQERLAREKEEQRQLLERREREKAEYERQLQLEQNRKLRRRQKKKEERPKSEKEIIDAEEKKRRQQRLRERLAKLTPEQQMHVLKQREQRRQKRLNAAYALRSHNNE